VLRRSPTIPALTKRIEMRRTTQGPRLAPRRSGLIFTGTALAALTLLIIFTATTRLTDPRQSSASTATTAANGSAESTAPSTTIGTRDEVVNRLHQIFRIRDQAIQTRDTRKLNAIYTTDCPCLRGDRALIERLKKERLVWRGVRVTLAVEGAEQVNDRLWIVNAIVKTSAFEIRRESGPMVRAVPSGQEHSRFALARPVGQDAWLLGQASVVERD
jgi:hypothetical protein